MVLVGLAVTEARRCNRMVLLCALMAKESRTTDVPSPYWWERQGGLWRARRQFFMADARERKSAIQ